MLLDVLLLEDDPAKKKRLLSFLEGKKMTMFGRVDTALCTADAISRLQEHTYDLFICDVLVPASLGGQPQEECAIDLFEQIDQCVGGVKRPRHSLAISSSDGLTSAAREFFSPRPWGILRYDETTDEFQTTIEKIFLYVRNANAATSRDERSCDVLILTALAEPEFLAVEEASAFTWSPLEPLDESQFVRFGSLRLGTSERTIAAAYAPRMGPVATAALATKSILKLRPKLVVMSGICAGIPGKAAIGDVVAADLCWDWQSGKYVDAQGVETFEISPHQVHIDDSLRANLMLLKRDADFWNSLAPLAVKSGCQLPKLVIGPMASGSSVLADIRVSERIKSTQHRSVVGLDMEVYGMYAAVKATDPAVLFVAFKAVCDQGDKQKSDQFQAYASAVAAATVGQFLLKYADSLI